MVSVEYLRNLRETLANEGGVLSVLNFSCFPAEKIATIAIWISLVTFYEFFFARRIRVLGNNDEKG